MRALSYSSIGELYARIRQTYVGEQKKDLLVVRYFYRPISFPLSVIPLLLGLTPNQVTFINFLTVLATFAFLSAGNAVATLIGAILFLLIFVIDCVDGNMARCLNQRRYFGKLIDGLVDVSVFFLYFAISIGNINAGTTAMSPVVELAAGERCCAGHDLHILF